MATFGDSYRTAVRNGTLQPPTRPPRGKRFHEDILLPSITFDDPPNDRSNDHNSHLGADDDSPIGRSGTFTTMPSIPPFPGNPLNHDILDEAEDDNNDTNNNVTVANNMDPMLQEYLGGEVPLEEMDDESTGPPQTKQKPNEKNWLTDEITDLLDSHKPISHLTANQSVDQTEMANAFSTVFEHGTVWDNMYQLFQAIKYLADMYGFTIKYSGNKIFCACGQSHQQTKANAQCRSLGFIANINVSKGSRSKKPKLHHLKCPWYINCSPSVRATKGDGITKERKPVKITGRNLDHNHPLTKRLMILAKKRTHQYSLRPEILRTLMGLTLAGPIPIKTYKNMLRGQLPPSVRITSTSVCNAKMKVAALSKQYDSVDDIPVEEIRRIFHPSSLESAPEEWYSDPTFSNIYQDAMMEVLSGDGTDAVFPIVSIMEKIKASKNNQYDYRVYLAESGRPQGVMHMVPAMIRAFIRFGDLVALDVQNRVKNKYGWNGCFPAGVNGSNTLQNYCDSLTLVEEDRFYAWVVRCMCEISGRPLQTIKIISVDGRLSEPLFRSYLPEFQGVIIRDHYHLKESIWKTQIGDVLYFANRHHLEGALNCHTKEAYDRHVRGVYEGLEAYPHHIQYFEGYFNHPQAIAKYLIRLIRGGLLTIGSSSAEQLHASNESAVPTRLMGIVSPEAQLFELVKRADDWISRDLQEISELELQQALSLTQHEVGSPSHKAISTLTRHAYSMFKKKWDSVDKYDVRKFSPDDDCDEGNIIISEITYTDSGKLCCVIPDGHRCSLDECQAMDIQCVHELANDEDFIQDKWGTRWWNEDTYRTVHADRSHLPTMASFTTNESNDMNVDVDENFCADVVPQGSPDEHYNPPTRMDVTVEKQSSKTRKNQSSHDYISMMTDFQGLATQLSRRPEIVPLWNGLVARTKAILQDSSPGQARSEFLSLATSTAGSMELMAPNVTGNGLANISNVPITTTRTSTQGAPIVNRIKSATEKRRKTGDSCGLCGMKGHRVSGDKCERRKQFGFLVLHSNVAQLTQDITTQNPGVFPQFEMQSEDTRYEQVSPLTNFMCIHGYGVESGMVAGLSQASFRADMNYTCVTLIFEAGVVQKQFTKCFIKTSKVSEWISRSQKNQKKVIKAVVVNCFPDKCK